MMNEPQRYYAMYKGEKIKVVFIDYDIKRCILRKPYGSSHVSYVADWKEIDAFIPMEVEERRDK